MSFVGPLPLVALKPAYRKRIATTSIILHSTHTPPDKSNIEAFLAANGRRIGLLEIGYHYLILRDGNLITCRPDDTIGSHCRWHNEASIGVALAGGVDEEGAPEDNFTAAQWEALKLLRLYLVPRYGPLLLRGHTELPEYRGRHRACPPVDMEKIRTWTNPN